ncbi:hypothetical protein ACFXB3_03555 [Streptomyces sp. NPDC059447]|uniref:hypothetical protein n=1 Tax=unclassified Streptomyces TaxID=2593676 RepID=UPI0036C4ECF4
MRTATLDATKPTERRETAVRLKDTVSVTLQGGPRAVERVHASRAEYFAVEGMVRTKSSPGESGSHHESPRAWVPSQPQSGKAWCVRPRPLATWLWPPDGPSRRR